ncbi:putative lipoprotein [Luteibacter rhizovicinus]|uniref:Putative lipoprotein n=1 Tax=Luteibacter rhizovicinus TaxID=242606 RepID=A0A4V2W3Q4_9GAMM|nr:lipoprotein [Luteibacter rhizovicinus]TCV92849.1 putative lipoprotein [Luteibacter rhizovicinus]
MRRTIPLLVLLLACMALAGCGNKGPLVPAPPKPNAPAVKTVAPTSMAAPAPSTTAPLTPFSNHMVQ